MPQETVALAGGRLTLGGEVTATVAPDDDGQFNYTDYERSALQLLRLGVTASFRPVERIALVTELRAEGDTNGGPWTALPFAAYVRVRPWKDRPFDIQAGRIPPVFGAAGRRIYANDNVLIGYPLAWQYLTVLRSDAVPSSADELIYARSAGWRASYTVGSPGYARGVPLTTAFRYDTGVQARLGAEHQRVSFAAAVTAGTLSSPGARDTNGGPQLSTRLAVRPVTGLDRGRVVRRGAIFRRRSGGADAHRCRVQLQLRDHDAHRGPLRSADLGRRRGVFDRTFPGESRTGQRALAPAGRRRHADRRTAVVNGPDGRRPLPTRARASRPRPGSIACRSAQLQGSYQTLPWDAPVTRVEAGVAWSATRNLIVRGSVQHNDRSRGRVRIVDAAGVAGVSVVLNARTRWAIVVTGMALAGRAARPRAGADAGRDHPRPRRIAAGRLAHRTPAVVGRSGRRPRAGRRGAAARGRVLRDRAEGRVRRPRRRPRRRWTSAKRRSSPTCWR